MGKFYYCYILRSEKSNKIHIGYSVDLINRLKFHNRGGVRATKPYVPYKLIFYSAFRHKDDAFAAEKYFNTTAGWRRIKRMLLKENL